MRDDPRDLPFPKYTSAELQEAADYVASKFPRAADFLRYMGVNVNEKWGLAIRCPNDLSTTFVTKKDGIVRLAVDMDKVSHIVIKTFRTDSVTNHGMGVGKNLLEVKEDGSVSIREFGPEIWAIRENHW